MKGVRREANRIVIGANTERSADVLRRIYEPLTAGDLSTLREWIDDLDAVIASRSEN